MRKGSGGGRLYKFSLKKGKKEGEKKGQGREVNIVHRVSPWRREGKEKREVGGKVKRSCVGGWGFHDRAFCTCILGQEGFQYLHFSN